MGARAGGPTEGDADVTTRALTRTCRHINVCVMAMRNAALRAQRPRRGAEPAISRGVGANDRRERRRTNRVPWPLAKGQNTAPRQSRSTSPTGGSRSKALTRCGRPTGGCKDGRMRDRRKPKSFFFYPVSKADAQIHGHIVTTINTRTYILSL